MSAFEKLAVPTPEEQAWTPNPQETEVERAKREDPAFAVDYARIRALARDETYNPAKHGPFEPVKAPKRQRLQEAKKMEGNLDVNLEELIGRFEAKAPYRYRPRLVTDEDRPDVRRVAEL